LKRSKRFLNRTFNSLSRDHIYVDDDDPRYITIKLSTPSLGITTNMFSLTPMLGRFTFNSLSRDHPSIILILTHPEQLSTPSLGITRSHEFRIDVVVDLNPRLSTPSLGITVPCPASSEREN
jgi:hypothetical protein